MRSLLIGMAATAALLGSTAWTQANAQPTREAARETPRNYSFAFQGAKVAQVAEEVLGATLGLDYTVDPEVSASISFRIEQRMTRAELLDAFETALAASNVALVREGEGFIITTREKARASAGVRAEGGAGTAGYQLSSVVLSSALPTDVAKAMEAMGSKELVVLADDKSGQLLLGGTAREIAAARAAIEVLDRGTPATGRTRLVDLRRVSPSTLARELRDVLDASGLSSVQVTPLPRLNSVLVAARSERALEEAMRWVRQLDVDAVADSAAIRVYRPRNVSAESLSVTLGAVLGTKVEEAEKAPPGDSASTSASAAPGEARPAPALPTLATRANDEGAPDEKNLVRVAVDREGNALVIAAPPERRAEIQRLLAELDVRPRQILIEASIVEVTLTDEFRMGVDWSVLADSGRVTITSSGDRAGAIAPTFPGLAATYLDTDVRAALDALGSRTRIEVVSAPKIVSLDNRQARLQIGDEVPVATQTEQSAATSTAPRLVSIDYRETGVLLEVTPRITGEDTVTLLVGQEVSSVARTTTSGIDSPTIQQRRFDSSLLLKSGGTVALGGMISNSDSNGATGIPFLSDIPGLGQLFKTDTKDKRRTELIVLLSATILPDASASDAAAAKISEQMREIHAPGLLQP